MKAQVGPPQWHALLAATAEQVEELGAAEVATLKRRWRQQYGEPPPPRSFLWHCFSFQQHSHLAGPAAVAAYDAQLVGAYVVFFDQAAWGFRCRSKQLPPSARLRELAARGATECRDVYVGQPNLTWAFCLTHEPDCGPYFARAAPVLPSR